MSALTSLLDEFRNLARTEREKGTYFIEWVMERQSVMTDKDSGIVKDANDWAIETMHDVRYPLSLLLRVINVSVKTVQLVAHLPKLDLVDDA